MVSLLLQGLGIIVVVAAEFLMGCSEEEKDPTLEPDGGMSKGQNCGDDLHCRCFNPEFFNQYSVPENPVSLPVVFHQITKDDGTGGFSLVDFDDRLNLFDQAFAPINTRFFLDHVNIIKSDALYDYQSLEESETLRSHLVDGAINIYVVGKWNGYEFGGGGSLEGYLILTEPVAPDVWAQELGHFFGLYHTFPSCCSGAGFVDGSNCRTFADHICDTPADPGPDWVNEGGCKVKNCQIISCPEDPKGDTYQPDIENFMASYVGCGTHYSPEQLQVMLCHIENFYQDLKPM